MIARTQSATCLVINRHHRRRLTTAAYFIDGAIPGECVMTCVRARRSMSWSRPPASHITRQRNAWIHSNPMARNVIGGGHNQALWPHNVKTCSECRLGGEPSKAWTLR